MREWLVNPIIVAGVTAVLMWLLGWVRVYLARRVKVESPEAKTLSQVVPAVNAILCVMGPLLDASIANLEVAKGICNGNVDRALVNTRKARDNFEGFLNQSARVESCE